jgi:hypothetical protein
LRRGTTWLTRTGPICGHQAAGDHVYLVGGISTTGRLPQRRHDAVEVIQRD